MNCDRSLIFGLRKKWIVQDAISNFKLSISAINFNLCKFTLIKNYTTISQNINAINRIGLHLSNKIKDGKSWILHFWLERMQIRFCIVTKHFKTAKIKLTSKEYQRQ